MVLGPKHDALLSMVTVPASREILLKNRLEEVEIMLPESHMGTHLQAILRLSIIIIRHTLLHHITEEVTIPTHPHLRTGTTHRKEGLLSPEDRWPKRLPVSRHYKRT